MYVADYINIYSVAGSCSILGSCHDRGCGVGKSMAGPKILQRALSCRCRKVMGETV